MSVSAAVLGQQLLHPRLGDVQRADHGVIVAPGRLRRAVVGQDDPPDVLHVLAAVHDLQRRQAQPLLIDLGGVGGEGAGRHAADLADVGDVADEPPGLALVEDGFHHQVLGHVALTAVGIVVDEDVAGTEGIEPDLVEHPLHRVLAGAEHRRAELRLPDEIAAGVEDHAGEVEPLIEDGRVAGPHHRGAHLAADVDERVVDDAQRHRIDLLDALLVW